MRPDDEFRAPGASPLDGELPFDGEIPFDPALADLVAELEAGGARARAQRAIDDRQRPATAFEAALRERLLAQLPATATAPSAGSALEGPARPAWRTDDGHRVAPRTVAPHVAGRLPAVLPAPRWTALTFAAALVLTVVGLQTSVFNPTVPSTRATSVSGATLVRDGVVSPLAAGTELRVGDEVRTASDGRATLELGDSQARLAGSSAVRLDGLANGRLELAQLDGRTYHRVGGDAARYAVTTASVTWTASGTAFDIARIDDPSGGETATLTAVEHDVVVDGPGLEAVVTQGRATTVRLSGSGGLDIRTGPIGAATLADRWLVRNARLDLALGFGLGIFEGVELAEVEPTPTPAPSRIEARPTASPTPAAPATPTLAPTPAATPAPTPKPTPAPTPRPTPAPTPTPPPPSPEIAALSLLAVGCGGGVVLDWSTYTGGAPFHHYTVLRNTSPEIPLAYPPQGGAVDFGTTYSTKLERTVSHDTSIGAGTTAWYRAMAFDAENRVIGASDAVSATAAPVGSLAPLTIAPDAGATRFTWIPLGGEGACFTYYKLVYSADDPNPGYLKGSPAVWVGSSQGESTTLVAEIPPGTPYYYRLEAVRATDFGKFIVAQSDVVQYTVP